jgi:hypothetical protein
MKYILFFSLAIFSLLVISCKKEVGGCADPIAINYNADADFSDNSLCEYNCSCGNVLQQELTINPNWPGTIEDPDYSEFWIYSISIKNVCSDNLKNFTSDTTLVIGEYICIDTLDYW